MNDFRLLIDGQLVEGDRHMDVINPADETVFAQCPVASSAQLDQAVAAANRAFIGWSGTAPEQTASAR